MAANSSISLVGLDFDSIKSNFINYLQSQDTFKDYNFLGSSLNNLLDILAYNTQYNAFYLNMVANEMFLDTALQRPSVVSHAKLLDYVPQSSIAPTAFVSLTANSFTQSSLTIPAYTNFMSESVNGINYNFVTVGSTTVNVTNNTATFNNIELKQGIPVTYKFTVDSTSNPTYTFELPDANIDTSTLIVKVQNSSTDTNYQIYNLASNYLELDSTSLVYFLQESLNGNYQIYFGNDILGKKLLDNNVIIVTYLVTQGLSSAGANNFVLMDSVPGLTNAKIYGIIPASNGSEKESINSIKYQAPKSYSAQKRAVTKDDYITLIQQNSLGITFDAVNVWGGEENNPPVYGQVYVCLKPSGGYSLTDTQKQRLVSQVIKPISMMTVSPVIVDPDYTYLKISANVLYDPKLTTLSSSQLQSLISSTIQNITSSSLNTFNATFSESDITYAISVIDPSILASELSIQVQKKFFPSLTVAKTYNLYFNTELERNALFSGTTSTPSMIFRDPTTPSNLIDGVYIEEVPTISAGIQSLQLINAGFGYKYPPTVTILGDGKGATATATINSNGNISRLSVTNAGSGYTSATVKITPAKNDTTGRLGSAIAVLQGQYGTLRSYYNTANNVKTILGTNIGTIDYVNGIITLNSFNPYDVNNPLGQLTITSTPKSSIISSTYNTIITVDDQDPTAISVNMISKG